MDAVAAGIGAESMLALTPIAIKQIPLNPVDALWSRVLTSGALGFFLADSWSIPWSDANGAASLGALNLAHIASSYESFRHLPAGQAMSLLYTFPLWNILFGAFFRREEISTRTYGLMMAATVGATLINMDPTIVRSTAPPPKTRPDAVWGIAMGLLMALTESGMFIVTKMLGWTDAAKSVWVLNTGAGLWLTLVTMLGIVQPPTFTGAHNELGWWGLTAFHTVSIFGGYMLRFYAIPRLTTVTYSVLSFTGLLASYLFGVLFVGEKPGWLSVFGAVVLVISGILIEIN